MTDLQSRLQQARELLAQGKLDEAERIYQDVLKATPDDPRALHFLGVLNAQRGHYAAAEDLIRRSVSIDDTNPIAHYNHGRVLCDLKRLEDSLSSYDRAITLAPAYIPAWKNRGRVLHDLKRLDEALADYDRLIALNPNDPEPFNDRGLILHAFRRVAEAVLSFDRAIALRPDYALALVNRSISLNDLQRFPEALASLDQAIALKPDYAAAFHERGVILRELKRPEEALAAFTRAHTLAPATPYLPGALLNAKMQVCQWSSLAGDIAAVERQIAADLPAALPFFTLGFSSSPAIQLTCARNFAVDRYPPSPRAVWRGETYRHQKIRVGYVCGEFREHVTAHFTAGIFENHDRNAFEIHAIATGGNDGSPARRRLEAAFDRFIDASLNSDREIADIVYRSELDILVDLTGYQGVRRTDVFAQRPSPVQVNYFGFPGTMGAPYIDYIIADKTVIPTDAQHFYSEKIAYLPDSYQPNDRRRGLGARAYTRAECGLPADGVVFSSLNASFKILPEVFAVWMRLLARVPQSVLWLLESNSAVKRNLLYEAGLRGISPDRLIFAPLMSLGHHIARSRLADLFLDTLPCNAHTTASDALFAGVPVVTCMGSTFAGRVAASLLSAIGLPELIVSSLDDYEALALKLAQDPAALTAVKAKLAANRETSPLFDIARYTRHLEAAYTEMAARSRRGDPPVSFSVPPAPLRSHE